MTSTQQAELEPWGGSLDDRDGIERSFDEHGYVLLPTERYDVDRALAP